MKIVIATHNRDKLKEIQREIDGFKWNVVSLDQFPEIEDIYIFGGLKRLDFQ